MTVIASRIPSIIAFVGGTGVSLVISVWQWKWFSYSRDHLAFSVSVPFVLFPFWWAFVLSAIWSGQKNLQRWSSVVIYVHLAGQLTFLSDWMDLGRYYRELKGDGLVARYFVGILVCHFILLVSALVGLIVSPNAKCFPWRKRVP